MSDAAAAVASGAAPPPPVLECRGLAKTYKSGPLEVPVLLGIDFAIRSGT